MNRSQVQRLAIVSGVFASTGIALMFGGAVAVILGAVSQAWVWLGIGLAAVAVGLGCYLTARRMVRRITAPSEPAEAESAEAEPTA